MLIKTDYHSIFNIDIGTLDKIDPNIKHVLNFWKTKAEFLYVNTSGSTGKPKKIKLKRENVIFSANATLDFFQLKNGSSFYCCIPSNFIGGIMMIIRAIINKGVIFLEKPTRFPFQKLNDSIDFAALSTSQIKNALQYKEKLELINTIIIGGGKLDYSSLNEISQLSSNCYQTFGMTETISHIALKQIDKNFLNNSYKTLDHVKISINNNEQLIIKSKEIGIESLTTNDIIEITGNQQFKHKGRIDNIVNSGGLKIHIEEIENTIQKSLDEFKFFIDKEPHKEFGEIPIMICMNIYNNNEILKSIRLIENNKTRPKKIYLTDKIFISESHKIMRKMSRNYALKLNNVTNLSSIL